MYSQTSTPIAATDERIFELYMDLVEDQILRYFMDELKLTRSHLVLLNRPIKERRKITTTRTCFGVLMKPLLKSRSNCSALSAHESRW